jgi:hypothetical protein
MAQATAPFLDSTEIQSIVQTSLKTAFGGSQSNLQLCWRLLAYGKSAGKPLRDSKQAWSVKLGIPSTRHSNANA